ncbi:spore germination protein (amino acid permease) [Bacillus sp. 491mf]|uniref:GerAB/ArcD/ProY family transporter n=1 Tax=unclassified Bacillus (in: firmicutes) TaxID=185979 RepID=UPI00054E4F98|nr:MULTISPECIES: GerAB/ArcD/ProY family transporter [unclassified Bacillus (in: firmicutes)]SFD59704.1 spore germination protein (amino acid permease) [Bacillus sp. 491mf]
MSTVKINYKVSPIFVFFLVHSAQFGVGVLGFARVIAKAAGYDAWMGVIIAGIIIHIIMWMIYYLLESINGNLITLHHHLFGKRIGNAFNLIFMAYFFLVSVSVMRTYVEIIQVWMFPTAATWKVTIFLSILSYYIISSGFRVMTGICVISVIATCGYIMQLFIVIKYANFGNLLPIFSHSFGDILKAAQASTYTMISFEVILMMYPFIKTPEKSHKFAQYGILFSNFLYLLSTILAFTFFSEKQLSKTIWSQLSITQVIHLPFIERLEYIAISGYALIVITSIILPLWAATRGLYEVFHVKQKYILISLLFITVVISQLLTERHDINNFITYISKASFWLVFVYIPILFLIMWVKKKWKTLRSK